MSHNSQRVCYSNNGYYCGRVVEASIGVTFLLDLIVFQMTPYLTMTHGRLDCWYSHSLHHCTYTVYILYVYIRIQIKATNCKEICMSLQSNAQAHIY